MLSARSSAAGGRSRERSFESTFCATELATSILTILTYTCAYRWEKSFDSLVKQALSSSVLTLIGTWVADYAGVLQRDMALLLNTVFGLVAAAAALCVLLLWCWAKYISLIFSANMRKQEITNLPYLLY